MPVRYGTKWDEIKPIWEKTWPEIRQGLSMGLETTGIASPITMAAGKVPSWLGRIFKPNEEQLMTKYFKNDPDRILQSMMMDRVGGKLAAAPATQYGKGATTVNDLVDTFSDFQNMIPGYPNATKQYMRYLDKIPEHMAGEIQMDLLKVIPQRGMPIPAEVPKLVGTTATRLGAGFAAPPVVNAVPVPDQKVNLTVQELIKQLGGF